MNDPSLQRPFYGWKNIGLLFGIYMLGVGFVYYGANVIFPAMVSDMGWSRGDASWGITLHGVLMGVFAPLVAISVNKYGARLTIMVGMLILTIGSALIATVTTTVWHYVIIWGVVMTVGFAFGGFLPVQTTITQWFDAKRATALGLVMSSAGIGGFIAQPFMTRVMETYDSWEAGWLAGTVFSLMSIALAFFLVNKPEDINQHSDGISHEEAASEVPKAPSKTYKTPDTWTLREAIRTPALWFLIILFTAAVMPLYLIIGHAVFHLTDLGYERMEAASVLSFMLAGSAVARFPLGWLGDRIEPRLIVFVLYAAAVISLSIFWKAPNMGLLVIAGAMFGMVYGGTVVMVPTMIANYFGRDSFASINGFIFPVQIIFASAAPVAAGYLADSTGNYNLSFMAVIGFIGFAAVCALLATPPKKKDSAVAPAT